MEFQDIIPQLWERYGEKFITLGYRMIIVFLIIIAGRIVIRISRHLTRKTMCEKLKADETIASVLRVVIHYGVIIVCLIMILDVFGVSTTSLIALLGAAGVAIAFALRDTLGNIAAGIVILLLRPFRKGDFIECGAILGTVQEIGFFATDVETADGIFIAAPNSSLWGLPVRNFSRNPKRRMDITVTISYSNSIDTAFCVLKEIIQQEPRFLSDPAAQVMVQSLGESGTGITLRAWVSSADYWNIYWDQMKIVKEKIQEAGLTIAFPQRNIHLVKDDQENLKETAHDR
ncbi:MAG: mechanosensitive ion channel [Treponema sp.]|nr:mechanosensitive ion channel [Treponema sp.]